LIMVASVFGFGLSLPFVTEHPTTKPRKVTRLRKAIFFVRLIFFPLCEVITIIEPKLYPVL
jgi:hypothetical protein